MYLSCRAGIAGLLACCLLVSVAPAFAQNCVVDYPAVFQFGSSLALADSLVDLVAAGDRLYGLDDAGFLSVVSIADPLAPVALSTVPVAEGSRRLAPAGDWLYVAGGAGGVHAVDVSDPAQPAVHLGVITAVDAFELEVCADQLFVAQTGTADLVCYACTDPLQPVLSGGVTLSELTGGEYTGGFFQLASCENDLYALGGTDYSFMDSLVLTRMTVVFQDPDALITPTGYYAHNKMHEWEGGGHYELYPEGADLICAQGRAYLALPGYVFSYWLDGDEIFSESYDLNNLFFLDTSDPAEFVLSLYQMNRYDQVTEWRDAARLAFLADEKLALAETNVIRLYNLDQDGAVESAHTQLIDSRTLAGSGSVLLWNNLDSGALETCDVAGSRFSPRIDSVAFFPAENTRWYKGADWSEQAYLRFHSEMDYHGYIWNDWRFYAGEADGSLAMHVSGHPGGVYFFTEQYVMYSGDSFYGALGLLLDWRANERLYYLGDLENYETWDLDDDLNVFSGGLVYHAENGDIGIYDFTVYPNQQVGLIEGPGSTQLTRWLLKDSYLIALGTGGDSSVLIYDVTDPAQPFLAHDFGTLNLGQNFTMSVNGDVLFLDNATGPDFYYDISDPTQPNKVTGDFYPGEVFGDIALAYAGGQLSIYRVTSLTESQPIGVYFHDAPITRATRWEGSLMVMDTDGISTLIDICALSPTGVGDPIPGAVAGGDADLAIRTIAPNPFNPRTKLSFAVARAQRIRVDVIDLAGRQVARLADRTYAVGEHAVVWDGKDGAGRNAAAGTYLLRVKGESMVLARKIALLK